VDQPLTANNNATTAFGAQLKKSKKLLYFRSLTAIQLVINFRSGT
jgi:hypothetical protein